MERKLGDTKLDENVPKNNKYHRSNDQTSVALLFVHSVLWQSYLVSTIIMTEYYVTRSRNMSAQVLYFEIG